MADNWMGRHGRKGQWTAIIPPQRSRRIELYLFRRMFASEGSVVQTQGQDGKSKSELNSEQQVVKLQFTTPPEGEFLPEPTLSGTFDGGLHNNDVMDFMQAVVDLAAEFGITATQMADKTDELKAVRYHLEDLRKLVFKEK